MTAGEALAQVISGLVGIYIGLAIVWPVNWWWIRNASSSPEWKARLRRNYWMSPVWPIALVLDTRAERARDRKEDK